MVFGFNAANLAFISEIKPSTLIKNSKPTNFMIISKLCFYIFSLLSTLRLRKYTFCRYSK